MPRAAVEVIPHGVSANLFQPKVSYPPFARRFVTIARLVSWKRVAMVIQAVIELHQALPDVTLTVYGEGELRTELEELIQKSGATAYIRLSGFVSKETLFATLCTYDAFVLPSISEAFGLVFLEAMAAGLPVIGFDFGGPADIIAPGVTGLLVERDELWELVEALKVLATTPSLAAELGEAARATATERFGWETIARRYLAAYRSVLSHGPTAPLREQDLGR